MTKTGILETISYKQKRIKFSGSWLTVDPFINLDALEFGKEYIADIQMDNSNWYVAKLDKVENGTNPK